MARVTIEDCLKVIDNAFDICSLAGRRAKDLSAGAEPLVDCDDKTTVIALREIAEEKIGMDYFEISSKEKIESQLFGSGITEEEVVSELSEHLEDVPPAAISAETVDESDPVETTTTDQDEAVAVTSMENQEPIEDSSKIKSE